MLRDDAFNTHLFNDLEFERKIIHEQQSILHNIMYLFSVIFMFVMRLLLPFNTYSYLSWFSLYTIVQTFLILRQYNIKKIDKIVSAIVCVALWFVKSDHMTLLILYSIFHMDPVVYIDKVLFGKNAYLENYHQLLLRTDTILFFIFWPIALVSFFINPCWMDIAIIPISFYYQIHTTDTPLNDKKKV